MPNVRYSDVQPPPTLASAYASESPITEYRITLSDDGFFVDVLVITKPNFTPPLERWPVLLGGIFCVAALAGAGLWFLERRKRRARAHADPEEDSSQA
jgi:hypothetical protein